MHVTSHVSGDTGTFSKTLFKGTNFADRERGKLDFDHHFAFLTNFLKR